MSCENMAAILYEPQCVKQKYIPPTNMNQVEGLTT